jgi:hypothetical protein
MARVQIFKGGNIQRQMPGEEHYRAPEFAPNGIAVGLRMAGRGLADFAAKQDEIEDVNAHVEANRLSIEHSELARQIGTRVKETLGEGAEAAANQGIADLKTGSDNIMAKASPRARQLLEDDVAQRNLSSTDTFLEHGFNEKKTAFESSSIARINHVVEDAADEDDETKALTTLESIRGINQARAQFFGKDKNWLDGENSRVISGFYKSRALKMATGANGSATAAIEYATKNRKFLSDDDYNSLITAYGDNSLDEMADSLIDGSPLPSATTTTEETPDGPTRKLDGASFFKAFVAPHEGSAYVVDSNGAGVKYGINAAHNPGVDVKGLSLEGAAKIFQTKYFEKSGADKLPPALAAAHADTFFLNEKEATRILKESGGDPDKYIALRRQFLNGLIASNPAKYGKYEKGWDQRTSDLQQFADRQGPGTAATHPLDIGPDTNLQGLRDSIMARTDIGASLKHKLIQRAEARRSDARTERSIVEDDAARSLTQTVTTLGDKFTDVKQLPQDAWLRASPTTRQQFTEMAKTNQNNKPIPIDVMRDIGFVRTFSPDKLADPHVLAEFGRRGVNATTLRQLAQEGGAAQGALAAAKPQAVDRSTLEALARPAFEAQGHFLWTTESKGKKALQERQTEAYQQEQLMGFLRDAAQTWAVNNPGKKADETTMKGWIATAMRVGARQQPIGTMNAPQTVIDMSPNDREAIKHKLRSVGLPATVENIATYYRRMLAQGG